MANTVFIKENTSICYSTKIKCRRIKLLPPAYSQGGMDVGMFFYCIYIFVAEIEMSELFSFLLF